MINELELVQIVDEVFGKMGIGVTIKINNRKILSGIAEVAGHPDKLIDITIAIDKIDKIGLDAVKDELRGKGLDESAIAFIEPILTLSGKTQERRETNFFSKFLIVVRLSRALNLRCSPTALRSL